MTEGLVHVMREFDRGGDPMEVMPPAPVAADDGLLPLHALTFAAAIEPASDLGQPGALEWIELQDLYIDPRYQRAVLAPGRKNVGRIVKGFNWSLFSPLVVAERSPGPDSRRRFAVIDGQHRAIGAKTHGGIPALPCLVIEGGPDMEAKAFAIINGQVTAILPTYIHAARVLARVPEALELDRICEAGGVRIQKYGNGMPQKAGETLAISTLEKCLARHGRDTLITALQCVTQTGNGNPGLLNVPVITGLCFVLDRNRRARDAGERLFAAIEADGGIRRMHVRAVTARAAERKFTTTTYFIAEVRKALDAAKLGAK